jgi:hypothetical protein
MCIVNKDMNYSDEQINDFLEVAQDIGITRAMRQLKYPNSWSTAQRWAKVRNITVAIDELKSKAKEFHQWYTTEEVLLVAQEGMNRIYEDLTTNDDLTPDDQKKLGEAFTKHYNVWANAQGKATNITESRQLDQMDAHLIDLLNVEVAKNKLDHTESAEEEAEH